MRLRASFAPKSGFAHKSSFAQKSYFAQKSSFAARPPFARLARAGAAALAFGVAAIATPASAQLFFEPFAYRFQFPPAERDQDPPMRAREATEAARSQGFEPVGRPTLNREVYVFDAQDRAGRPVRVIMDAYEGEILRVMRRPDGPRRGGRLEAAPGRERTLDHGDEPNVIEGVGPEDARPRSRRKTQAPARARAPKREAAAPTQAPSEAPDAAPARAKQATPAPAPKPSIAVAPLAPPEPTAPRATPAAPAPPVTEAPGPIPTPPFASGAYSKPPAPRASDGPPPAIPPVVTLDEVKPQVKASPPVPPATLE